jgi:hypothetical protein
MMILVSGKTLAGSVVVPNLRGVAINSQPLGRIVAGYTRKTLFISFMQWVACVPFIAHSDQGFKSRYILSPCGILSKER